MSGRLNGSGVLIVSDATKMIEAFRWVQLRHTIKNKQEPFRRKYKYNG